MKVAIIGYGVEGKSSCVYWRAKGADVTVCDKATDIVVPDGVATKLGSDYLEGLEEFDLLVRSPGTRPDLLPQGANVTSATNEFMEQCPAPIIGVTGTKGKGTTASLVAAILKAAGKTVWLGGNIGTPALDFLGKVQSDDVVVLELSSFQLMDARRSPKVAVCLMVAPEHLDYHTDEGEYARAKGNIFAFQTADDVAVYNANNAVSSELVTLSKGRRVAYDASGNDRSGAYVAGDEIRYGETLICKTSDIALVGAHNQQNVCAAVAAAWEFTQDVAAITEAIRTFKGLSYRLQEIATVNGVRYINDSISTTPESALAAIQAFDQPKIAILGGSDKGIAFDEFAESVKAKNVRAYVLIGATAPMIEQALQRAGSTAELIHADTMAAAVSQAANLAQSGDVVLLSPACASFGMFKNYKDRGDQFNQAVSALT